MSGNYRTSVPEISTAIVGNYSGGFFRFGQFVEPAVAGAQTGWDYSVRSRA